MCDVKILLDIPYEIRKKRAMKRDNITEEAFDLREQASINFDGLFAMGSSATADAASNVPSSSQ